MESGSLADWVLAISAFSGAASSFFAAFQGRMNGNKQDRAHALQTEIKETVATVQAQTNGMGKRLEELARTEGREAGIAEAKAKTD